MNDIFTLLSEVLISEFAAQGITVRVTQSYGDLPPALEQEPLFILRHLATERVGWQSRQARRQAMKAEIVEAQRVAETIGVSVRLPTAWSGEGAAGKPDAIGLLTTASLFVQGQPMLDAANAANIGVQAVKTLTSSYIQNEQKQWENLPGFELTLCHTLTLSRDVNAVEHFTNGIYPL